MLCWADAAALIWLPTPLETSAVIADVSVDTLEES